jgi:hypothetical protein
LGANQALEPQFLENSIGAEKINSLKVGYKFNKNYFQDSITKCWSG